MSTTSAIFTRFAANKLRQYLERIETCIARLDDRQLWLRGNENSNAAANLCLHFTQHTGQIIYATKALSGEDLGFCRQLTGTRKPPPPPAGGETP